MSTWTAPEDGWYEMGSGQPRKLSDEEAAAMSRGEEAGASVARLLAGEEGGPSCWTRCRTRASSSLEILKDGRHDPRVPPQGALVRRRSPYRAHVVGHALARGVDLAVAAGYRVG